MAELVDAQDLKSCVPLGRAGSSPALGTKSNEKSISKVKSQKSNFFVPKVLASHSWLFFVFGWFATSH